MSSIEYTILKAIETRAHFYRSFLKITTSKIPIVLSSKHDLVK